jgi:LysM repeat protein
MDASTLAQVMTVEGHTVTYNRLLNRLDFDANTGGPSFKANEWMASLNQALIRARCVTYPRVAMFLAQLGAESGSFRYTEELASGAAYEWRQDLGNIYAGDGMRYKGRSYIQVTGRHNYGALSSWAFAKGFVPSPTYFVDNPEMLADVKFIFLGPIWYWTVARDMNPYGDARDIKGATWAVNGGLNNLAGRTARYEYALTFGRKLLPPAPVVKPVPVPSPNPTYVVKAGDTLSGIATAFKTTWQNLQQLNGLSDPNRIYVGQRLRVPAVSGGKTVSAPPKPVRKPVRKPVNKPVYVTVRNGDTLSAIAGRHGTNWQSLQKMNNLRNPNVILVGQRLRVS